MSTANTPQKAPRSRVVIDAGRLWGGGVATAVVAALVAAVGVLICRDLLDVKLVEPPMLRITDSFPINYAITAAILALAATGLAHLLSLVTPRPRAFFNWIVGLITVATMVVPFASGGQPAGQDLCGGDQYGDRHLHCQPAVCSALSDGRRRRALLAAALTHSIALQHDGARSTRVCRGQTRTVFKTPGQLVGESPRR